jgi:hypothetical protein
LGAFDCFAPIVVNQENLFKDPRHRAEAPQTVILNSPFPELLPHSGELQLPLCTDREARRQAALDA